MVEYWAESEDQIAPEEPSRVFAALGDPTRCAIIERVSRDGATTVGALAEPFPISLNAVSKHVKVLEEAGLLRREVRGREHWLRVDPGALDEVREWLDRQRRFWEARLEALDAYLGRSSEAESARDDAGTPEHGMETPPDAPPPRRDPDPDRSEETPR